MLSSRCTASFSELYRQKQLPAGVGNQNCKGASWKNQNNDLKHATKLKVLSGDNLLWVHHYEQHLWFVTTDHLIYSCYKMIDHSCFKLIPNGEKREFLSWLSSRASQYVALHFSQLNTGLASHEEFSFIEKTFAPRQFHCRLNVKLAAWDCRSLIKAWASFQMKGKHIFTAFHVVRRVEPRKTTVPLPLVFSGAELQTLKCSPSVICQGW